MPLWWSTKKPKVLQHNLFPFSTQKKPQPQIYHKTDQNSLAKQGTEWYKFLSWKKQQMMIVSCVALDTAGKFLDTSEMSLLQNKNMLFHLPDSLQGQVWGYFAFWMLRARLAHNMYQWTDEMTALSWLFQLMSICSNNADANSIVIILVLH